MQTVPVILVNLTKEQAQQLNIALNRISGEWDVPKLAALIEDLKNSGADVDLTGFDEKELDHMFASLKADEGGGLTDPDAIPETPEKPITKLGDIWVLGKHRLLCGDATEPAAVEKLMAGKKAQLVFTDPPYAVGYTKLQNQLRPGIRHPGGDAPWDDMKPQDYSAMLKAALVNAQVATDKAAPIYLWFASVHVGIVIQALEDTGWAQRNLIILLTWVKNTFAGSLFAQFKHKYEACFYSHKVKASPRWYGPTNETTVWEYDKPHKNPDHPTSKPVELATRAMTNSSTLGDIVLDLFLGSGSTMIAAQQMGRACYGTELEPRYCDIIVRRWEEFTGKPAQHFPSSPRHTNKSKIKIKTLKSKRA